MMQRTLFSFYKIVIINFITLHCYGLSDIEINDIDNLILKREKLHRVELIQNFNIERQDLLMKQCKSLNIWERTYHHLREEQLEHLLVDKQRKLLYCYVPKVCYINLINLMINLAEFS